MDNHSRQLILNVLQALNEKVCSLTSDSEGRGEMVAHEEIEALEEHWFPERVEARRRYPRDC